jgi:hypothetical protein
MVTLAAASSSSTRGSWVLCRAGHRPPARHLRTSAPCAVGCVMTAIEVCALAWLSPLVTVTRQLYCMSAALSSAAWKLTFTAARSTGAGVVSKQGCASSRTHCHAYCRLACLFKASGSKEPAAERLMIWLG